MKFLNTDKKKLKSAMKEVLYKENGVFDILIRDKRVSEDLKEESEFDRSFHKMFNHVHTFAWETKAPFEVILKMLTNLVVQYQESDRFTNEQTIADFINEHKGG